MDFGSERRKYEDEKALERDCGICGGIWSDFADFIGDSDRFSDFWRIDHASVRFQISVGGKGDSVFRRRYGRQLSYQSDRRALPDALYHLNKITRIQAMILYLLLDTGATALGLLCVDYFMDSVSATGISVFVVSLFFALVDIPNHPKERRRTR